MQGASSGIGGNAL